MSRSWWVSIRHKFQFFLSTKRTNCCQKNHYLEFFFKFFLRFCFFFLRKSKLVDFFWFEKLVLVSLILKGAPIAKSGFSTFEFGVETIIIGFVILQNPGSGGRNFRFGSYTENIAKFIFLVWCFLMDNFWPLKVIFCIKLPLVTLLGTQRTIIESKILEKNKSRFLGIFFPKIFNFFFHFFYGFFKFSTGSSLATAIWVTDSDSWGSTCIRTSHKTWLPR